MTRLRGSFFSMQARYIREIGVRVSLRRYWGEDCPLPSGRSYHNALRPLADRLGATEGSLNTSGDNPDQYPPEAWPTACEACGTSVPEDAERQVFQERLYDCPEGRPQPGDLRWMECPARMHGVAWMCPWSNCEGRHLYATLPNGCTWDMDSRASNCDQREEKTHRCWVRHGEPPAVHVDKAGATCGAGAGSIACGSYHGFLHHGHFTPG